MANPNIQMSKLIPFDIIYERSSIININPPAIHYPMKNANSKLPIVGFVQYFGRHANIKLIGKNTMKSSVSINSSGIDKLLSQYSS